MKKLLYIFALTVFLSACSAEKRLSRFLGKHPELQYVDTTYIHDTIYLPEERKTTEISLSDLVAMDSTATAALSAENMGLQDSLPSKSVCTDSHRSSAALRAKGGGKFDLVAIATPDTIVRTDTITQDHYITGYKDRDVIVYKQKWWQEGLMWMGIFALVYIGIIISIKAIKKLLVK